MSAFWGFWQVPNLPGANPLVAERAPWRSSQSYVTGVSSLLEIPTDSCHFFCTPGNPCATPIVTRGEGSFSYQGVSTRGVRHSPGVFGHEHVWDLHFLENSFPKTFFLHVFVCFDSRRTAPNRVDVGYLLAMQPFPRNESDRTLCVLFWGRNMQRLGWGWTSLKPYVQRAYVMFMTLNFMCIKDVCFGGTWFGQGFVLLFRKQQMITRNAQEKR